MAGLADSYQRPINYLRVSVTDRCNLRCIYCMPPGGIPLLHHSKILSYEEIFTIVAAAAELGITKVRLTGGEPLVRAGIAGLVRMLASIKGIDDISMTTNGILLACQAEELKQAGLRRVNISLDTLVPERFKELTRGGDINQVLRSIEVARNVGLNPVKINMVVIPGLNEDEINDFGGKTVEEGWHVRFIEHMPFYSKYDAAQFVPVERVRRRLESLGTLEPADALGNGPAKYFHLPSARGTVGFITPMTEHFCVRCNRLRLTADGKLRPCLLSDTEFDLRPALRGNLPLPELKELIKKAAASKPREHHLAEGSIPQSRPFSQVGG